MKHLHLLAVVAALSGTVLAQQNIVYHTNSTPTGTKNAFPFGAAKNGVRQQMLIPGSVFGTTPVLIQDLFVTHMGGFGGSASLTEGEIVYANFEIKLSITPAATLSNTWANNIPNPTTVQTGRLRMRWKVGAWTPLGLQQSFLWAPTAATDNLCVDCTLWSLQDSGLLMPDVNGYIIGTASDAAIPRVYLLNWPVSQPATGNLGTSGTKFGFLLGNGNFVGRGLGCLSSANTRPASGLVSGTWPKLGALLSPEVNNAGAVKPTFLTLGSNELTHAGLQLPVDLSVINAPGCMLWIDPLVMLGVGVTSASGYATTVFPVPSDAQLLAARLYMSWTFLDPANPLGLVTSDYGLLILGQ